MSAIRKFQYLLCCTCLFMVTPCLALEKNIEFLVSDNPQSNYVADQLESKLLSKQNTLSVQRINIEKNTYSKQKNNAKLTVSIGTKATRILINNLPSNPSYSLMIPSVAYENLTKNLSQQNIRSALYLDQPFERYLLTIKKLLPKAKRIGVFTNTSLSGKQESYEQISKELDLELITKPINTITDPINEINELFKQTDVLLLLPEKIINKLTTKWILFSAYRHQKPVIGFSKKFLDAGALASLHSKLDDLTNEALKDILYFLETNNFQKPAHYPERYEIRINDSVSKTLNIPIIKIDIE